MPGSGSDATAGFALPLPSAYEVPESLHHPVSAAIADDAELDITIPEVPPLDEIEPEACFESAIDCTGCQHRTTEKLCRFSLLSPTEPIFCPKSVKLDTTGTTRQIPAGKLMFGELWKAATMQKFSVAAKL